MKKLAQHFKELQVDKLKFLVLGHPHADPDAVGSIIGIAELLKSLGGTVKTGVPKTLSNVAKSVLESLEIDIEIDPDIDADVAIILDTSTLEQLEEYYEKIKNADLKLIFIDHHRPDGRMEERVDVYYVEEEATSTVELVLKLGQAMKHKFGPKTSTLMLTGIISDTGHFKFADEQTFKAVADLIENGADYRKALEALQTPEEPSKRVAMLKAAQRSDPHKYHGNWVVFSEIGAYESDAATMFLKIGADVSIVASQNGESIRISSRARSGVASETHLHLGELMSNIADQFGGTGGGHAGAAGMKVKAELEEVKEKALKELEKMLEPRSSEDD